MKGLMFAALAALSMPAAAQVVSKCPDGKGGFVYQDAPCTHGASARDWDSAAHRLPPGREAQLDAERRHREAMAAANRRQPAQVNTLVHNNGPSQAQQRARRCDTAKAHRKRELDRLGLRRTYAILRTLDDYVRRECRTSG